LSKLNKATTDVRKSLDDMRFHDAAGSIYHFFWHEFCDWYIELVKPTFFGDNEAEKQVSKKVLVKVLEASLKLLHPFMPHVTEELWQNLPFENDERKDSIMISQFPKIENIPLFEDDSNSMENIIEIVKVIRNIRSESNVKPSVEIDIILDSSDEEAEALIQERESYIRKLARVKSINYIKDYEPGDKTASSIVKIGKIFIPLEGLVDFSEEVKRIEKEIIKLKKDFERTDKKLNNQNFLSKANPDVVEKERGKHAEMKEKIDYLSARLEEIA